MYLTKCAKNVQHIRLKQPSNMINVVIMKENLRFEAPVSYSSVSRSIRHFLTEMNYYDMNLPKCNTKHFAMPIVVESVLTVVKLQLFDVTKLGNLHTSNRARFVLKTDISQVAVAAVLQQIVNGQIKPLSSFSRKLTPVKTGHNTFS